MEIWKEFRFEAAHFLPNLPEQHKCRRLHGHSFRFRVVLEGSLQEPQGWICDFSDVSDICKPIVEQLDHFFLNEIEGLENPTSENIAQWIWQKIHPLLPLLARVELFETCTSGCIYRGE